MISRRSNMHSAFLSEKVCCFEQTYPRNVLHTTPVNQQGGIMAAPVWKWWPLRQIRKLAPFNAKWLPNGSSWRRPLLSNQSRSRWLRRRGRLRWRHHRCDVASWPLADAPVGGWRGGFRGVKQTLI